MPAIARSYNVSRWDDFETITMTPRQLLEQIVRPDVAECRASMALLDVGQLPGPVKVRNASLPGTSGRTEEPNADSSVDLVVGPKEAKSCCQQLDTDNPGQGMVRDVSFYGPLEGDAAAAI